MAAELSVRVEIEFRTFGMQLGWMSGEALGRSFPKNGLGHIYGVMRLNGLR